MRTRMRGLTLAAIAGGLFLVTGTGDLRAQQSGVQLWGQTCGRCHNARPVNERTDREWATIVNHMRARANLTRSDARAILEFLQAANGSDAGQVSRATPETTETGEVAADRTRPTPPERAAPEEDWVRELMMAYLQRVVLGPAPPQ